MPKKAPEGREKFQPYHEEYVALGEALNKLPWSKDWSIKAMMYGHPKVRGTSLRMWKNTWPELIHFESCIGNQDIERGSATIMFHIETPLDSFGVKRNQFNQALIESGASLMDGWDGYVLSPKSFQTLKITIPFETGKIALALKPEFVRLQRLGKVIDQALNL